MKANLLGLARRGSAVAAALGFMLQTQAATIFTDDFKDGASPAWGNTFTTVNQVVIPAPSGNKFYRLSKP